MKPNPLKQHVQACGWLATQTKFLFMPFSTALSPVGDWLPFLLNWEAWGTLHPCAQLFISMAYVRMCLYIQKHSFFFSLLWRFLQLAPIIQ